MLQLSALLQLAFPTDCSIREYQYISKELSSIVRNTHLCVMLALCCLLYTRYAFYFAGMRIFGAGLLGF